MPYGHIYSYDPVLNVLEKHISISDMNPTAATMTSDGKIYMYLFRQGSPNDEEHDALFLYTPQTETMEYIVVGLEVDFVQKEFVH